MGALGRMFTTQEVTLISHVTGAQLAVHESESQYARRQAILGRVRWHAHLSNTSWALSVVWHPPIGPGSQPQLLKLREVRQLKSEAAESWHGQTLKAVAGRESLEAPDACTEALQGGIFEGQRGAAKQGALQCSAATLHSRHYIDTLPKTFSEHTIDACAAGNVQERPEVLQGGVSKGQRGAAVQSALHCRPAAVHSRGPRYIAWNH